MGTPFSPSIMSGNFDFPPALARNDPNWDDSRPTTIDPWATHASYTHPRGAVSYDLTRRHHYGRSYRDGSSSRPFAHMQGSTRRHHHEDQAAATQTHFPTTSALRAHASAARIRRNFHGRTRSPYQSPMQSTLPQIRSPDLIMDEYSELGSTSRSKRRRLDTSDRTSRNFTYDWKGRCVPGRLKMELRYCDGGLHADAAAHDRVYTEQNILVNDQSVYCTHKNKCNLILQHVDEACFSLTKMVIKAPSHGFTSPIQEGMIFVGMDAEELTRRTARYRLRLHSALDIDGAFDEYPVLAYDYRPISRRRDSMSRNIPPPISDAISRYESPQQHHSYGPFTEPAGASERAPNESPDHALNRAMVQPRTTQIKDQGFHITSHCDPPSDDEEEESSPQTLFDRQQREHMPEHFLSTSDEDAEHAGTFGVRRSTLSPRQYRSRRRGKRRSLPLGFEVPESSLDKESVEAVLAPHASFFIEREKSVVSLCFDPPVAGKFILFKLWSLSDDQNIDIQSIVVHGFAGPRVFPAMDFR